MKKISISLFVFALLVSACGGNSASDKGPLSERLQGWEISDTTSLTSELRKIAVTPPTFYPIATEPDFKTNADGVRDLKSGLYARTYHQGQAILCPAMKSPFDLVRAEDGSAPEILGTASFQNRTEESAKNSKGAAMLGDIIIFDSVTKTDFLRNYDQLIAKTGSTCSTQYVAYKDVLSCLKFEPELVWDYKCSVAKTGTSSNIPTFTAAVAYSEQTDNSDNEVPIVGIIASNDNPNNDTGHMWRFSIYWFSENLQTVVHLNYVLTSGTSKSDIKDLDQNAVAISGALLNAVRLATDNV